MEDRDFDGAWKLLAVLYLEDVVLKFFPKLHALIDWSKGYTILATKLTTPNPDGTQRDIHADSLIKVVPQADLNSDFFWHIAHLEFQAQKDKRMRERLLEYNLAAMKLYDIFVLSMIILMDDDPNWNINEAVPVGSSYGLELHFFAAKLWDWRNRLDELLAENSPVSLVMWTTIQSHLTQNLFALRFQRNREITEIIFQSNFPPAIIMALLQMIDNLLPLGTSPESDEYRKFVDSKLEGKQMELLTTYEKRAKVEGKIETSQKNLCLLLNAKFQSASNSLFPQIETIRDPEKLESLMLVVLNAPTLEEFTKAL